MITSWYILHIWPMIRNTHWINTQHISVVTLQGSVYIRFILCHQFILGHLLILGHQFILGHKVCTTSSLEIVKKLKLWGLLYNILFNNLVHLFLSFLPYLFFLIIDSFPWQILSVKCEMCAYVSCLTEILWNSLK